MTTGALGSSPARLARATGGLLLVMAASAMFAELGVRATLIVPGDAELTAARILASPLRFRLGLAGYLVAFLCDVPVAVYLYVMLRRIDPTRALLAMALRLVYAAVVSASLVPYAGAALLLSTDTDTDAVAALEPSVRHALALWAMDSFRHGFALALVLFGAHLMVLGPLLARSRPLPKIFGVLLTLAGAAYVLDSVMLFVAPALQPRLAPLVGALAMSELALALWLVIRAPRFEASTVAEW